MVKYLFIILCCITFVTCRDFSITQQHAKEELGRAIFFDPLLSEPTGQSCATCHIPAKGFADSLSRPISEGAQPGLFSKRNSMSVSYAVFVPYLEYSYTKDTYVGGLFWDGRSDDLTAQAGEPFLDPLEMRNTDKKMLVDKIKKAPYYKSLIRIYGASDDVEEIFYSVCDAISYYESSEEVNPFSSKFDSWKLGVDSLSASEARGLELFKDKGQCASCHILDNDPIAYRVLFTDHTYDNLGFPRNPDNPYYKMAPEHNPDSLTWVDLGLGVSINDPFQNGKFRVPTLRNITLTHPYGHNGYFKTLEDIVHFYNVRDVSDEYPEAEYPQTVNRDELGDLKLTPQEEADIVAFLHTLTDGHIKKQ